MLQFARIFTGFQVEYGNESSGPNNATLLRVPVRYGDASRNAQTIIQENSSNSLPSTPLMTFYITGFDYDRDRIQEPYHVSKIAVRQRTYDSVNETYETTQGNAFTIERLMPVPYKLTINLDIWTSNTNQKFQLLEQICTLFNPSLEIQSTDNYIDWTSLSVVYLDRTNWSSRTIPVGTDNPIDIATLTFSIPIWISSPAKVKKLGVVERIVAGIFDAQGDASNAILDNDLLLGTRQIFTPWNYALIAIGDQLQIVQQPQLATEPGNNEIEPPSIDPNSALLWSSVIGAYGVVRPGISQIRLYLTDDTFVVGTIAYNTNDDRFLHFTPDPDTVPANTLLPVNAVINPLISGPGTGLPTAAVGQRYLLTEDLGSWDNVNPPTAWLGPTGQPVIAKTNDIIQYDGNRWTLAFQASQQPAGQFVTNLTTGIQYEWTSDGWIKSYQGIYNGGSWSLVL